MSSLRIVSLLPSATELVASLGVGDQLVGISHECDYPQGIQSLPQLTSSILEAGLSPLEIDTAVARAKLDGRPLYLVDGARLAELQPDLILTQGLCSVCAVTPDTIHQSLALAPLADACDAPILSLEAQDFAGVCRDLVTVGQAIDRSRRADQLKESLESRWASIPPPATPPRAFLLEWPDPPWSAGHWVPEQITAAGGIPVLSEAGAASRPLPLAEIAAADPDLIVSIACGFGLEENRKMARQLLENSATTEIRAVREGRFFAADANGYFSRPAPRLVDGAEILGALFREEWENPLLQGRLAPVSGP